MFGFPLDIYNLWMVLSPDTESIAQSLTAQLINSVYAVANFFYELYFSLYKSDMSIFFVLVLLFFPITFPLYLLLSVFDKNYLFLQNTEAFLGAVQAVTQVFTFLYMYQMREGEDLISDVLFP